MTELPSGIVQMVVLIVVLGVIGWGAGLAAALAWRGLRGTEPVGLRIRIAALVVALMVATSCSYAYAVVLTNVGLLAGCGLMRHPVAC